VTIGAPGGGDRIGAAEVIAVLSLATDLGLGVALEHGLRSTLFAMRLCERLGVVGETAVTAGSNPSHNVFAIAKWLWRSTLGRTVPRSTAASRTYTARTTRCPPVLAGPTKRV
jgi:hypothetical protein